MEEEKILPSELDSQQTVIPESIETVEAESSKEAWRLKDFKGFIHFHSWEGSSCGGDRIYQIKQAVAKKTGLEYIGFAEHVGWPGQEYWYGKIEEEYENIDRLNQEGGNPKMFKGIEANVFPDGTIDAPDKLLSESEIVVASFHYKNTDKQGETTGAGTTERWQKVMDKYPDVNVLGHPLRDLPESEWDNVDWDAICQKAKERNVAIELNISDNAPKDLPQKLFEAIERHGNLVVVAPDFHRIAHFLSEDNLTDSQKALLQEHMEVEWKIASITFNPGEEINKSGLSNEEKAQKIRELKGLRARLKEIEDSEALSEIYQILVATETEYKSVRNTEGEIEQRKIDRRYPLDYGMLMKYARRINRLRKPANPDNPQSIIPKESIINMWSKDKLATWIEDRKATGKLRKGIDDTEKP